MMAAVFEDDFVTALFDSTAPAPVSGQAAFAVYRNTVMKGCIDTLQANYPAVQRLTGEHWFRRAAAAYVRSSPPTSPVMLTYGEGFDRFLREFAPAADLTYLPDVALLDRLWLQCHVASDAAVVDGSALTGMDPSVMAASVLRPHPAARWRYFESCPAYTIWSRNRAQVDVGDLDWKPEGALLTRPDETVRWIAAGAEVCALLDSCARGETLEQAAQACLTANPQADLIRIIATLIEQGAFTTITWPIAKGD